jgi:hypothetical protein
MLMRVRPSSDFLTSSAPVHGPRIVDCSDNPFDLRPALDALQAEIERRSAEGPLVVLLAERHTLPSRVIMGQALMSRLLRTGTSSIAYGIEQDHNMVEQILTRAMNIAVPPELKGQITEADRDGRHLARAFSAVHGHPQGGGPAALLSALDFCLQNQIPVHANDIAKIYPNLDLSDPMTCDLLKGYDLGARDIDVRAPFGVALRNMTGLKNVSRRMQDNNIDCYIQAAGAAHLFGRKGQGGHPYSSSLCAVFKEAGINILPVFLTTKDFGLRDIPGGAAEVLRDAVIIKGLDETEFDYRRSDGGQSAYLKDLDRESGGEIGVRPRMTAEEHAMLCEELMAEIPEWCHKAPAPAAIPQLNH